MTDTSDSHLDNATDTTDSGLTPAEAAALLGVSERTIYRRIDKGILQARRIDTPRGEVLRVLLDGVTDSAARAATVVTDTPPPMPDSTADTTDTPTRAAPAPELLKALELADQLRRDNAALVQRNEQLAGQLGFVQAKLQDAEEQIRLLMAPKDEAPAPSIAQNQAPPDAHNAPVPAPRRSLWARMVRRLAGEP